VANTHVDRERRQGVTDARQFIGHLAKYRLGFIGVVIRGAEGTGEGEQPTQIRQVLAIQGCARLGEDLQGQALRTIGFGFQPEITADIFQIAVQRFTGNLEFIGVLFHID